ncbi:MAG: hypothetical protein Q4D90_03430 [bacterium]|nr:hypothetical protein [bacterium]
MDKCLDILCCGLAFFLISITVFVLILYVPPVPGDANFALFATLAALFAAGIGALLVTLLFRAKRT